MDFSPSVPSSLITQYSFALKRMSSCSSRASRRFRNALPQRRAKRVQRTSGRQSCREVVVVVVGTVDMHGYR